jgi:hypothetical protein
MARAMQSALKNVWNILARDEHEFEEMLARLKNHYAIPYTDKDHLTFPIAAKDIQSIAARLSSEQPPIDLAS